jgi:hypothetical protein
MYKIFLGGLFLIGIAAIGAGVYFYVAEDGGGVGIEVSAPESPLVGIPFTAKISISNEERVVLGDAKVSLILPEGMAFVGRSPNQNIETKSLGRIGVGGVIQEDFELIATNGENTIKRITVSASYTPEGVSSNFEERKEADIAFGTAGIALNLILPEVALPGEDFAMEVSYKNISQVDLDGLQLRLDYPPGFEFKKSTLPPDLGKNIWKLGGLRKGSEMKFSVTGNLAGPSSSKHDIRSVLQAEFEDELYQVSEKTGTVELTASPLGLNIVLVSGGGETAAPGSELQYAIKYQNSADQGFRDAVVKVQLTGEMFDFGSLRSNGIVAASGNSITWNPATSPELGLIQPNSSGELTFAVRTKGLYPIRRLSDKNFVLKVDARIESPTVLPSAQSKATVGIGRLETKVRGDLRLETSAFFRDANAGIVNRGPFPPRVGIVTNFTVHWILRNYATDVTGATVMAALPPGVKYAGVSQVPVGSLSYADGAQVVQWQIDRIPAGKGVIDKPLELVFQVEAVPQPGHIKTYLPIIGETTVTAKDDFTGLELRGSDGAITSALPDDPTVSAGAGIVVQ